MLDLSQIDPDAVLAAVEADELLGFCLACGDIADGVEPDAREYRCAACGASQVYGAEEVLIAMAR